MSLKNITILSRLRSFSIWEIFILYYKKEVKQQVETCTTPLVSVSRRGLTVKVKSLGPYLEP